MDMQNIEKASSTEFIDEAQNAVIKAVDNVSEMISETTKLAEFAPNSHHEIFYQSPEFWVGMAFVIVVVALFKPVSSIIKSALTNRKNTIINKINEAEKLRDEAQELLAQYERKFIHAKDEAQKIFDASNLEVKNLTEYELQKMEKELALKQNDVKKLIDSSVEKTKAELNNLAVYSSIDIVKMYIFQNVNKKQHEKLINNSIKNILNTFKS